MSNSIFAARPCNENSVGPQIKTESAAFASCNAPFLGCSSAIELGRGVGLEESGFALPPGSQIPVRSVSPYPANESLREITWNGVNETVIRCSSSTVSSLARSSKILTIAAFLNGKAVSKVV
jgi:hypothetical protein